MSHLETTSSELTSGRQVQLLTQLQQLAKRRANREAELRSALDSTLAEVRRRNEEETASLQAEFERRRHVAEEEQSRSTELAQRDYQLDLEATQVEYQKLRDDTISDHEEANKASLAKQQEDSWQTWALYEANKDEPQKKLERNLQSLEQKKVDLDTLQRDVATILRDRRVRPDEISDETETWDGEAAGETAGSLSEEEPDQLPPLAWLEETTRFARQAGLDLVGLRIPRLYEGIVPFVLWGVLTAACSAAASVIGGLSWGWAIGVGLAGSTVLTGGGLAAAWPVARRQTTDTVHAFQRHLAQARRAWQRSVIEAKRQCKCEAEDLVTQREQRLADIQREYSETVEAKDQWKESTLSHANSHYPAKLSELRAGLEQLALASKDALQKELTSITSDYHRLQRALDDELAQERKLAEEAFERGSEELQQEWSAGLQSFQREMDQMRRQCEEWFPDWEQTLPTQWQRPTGHAASVKFGTMSLDMNWIKDGVSEDSRYRLANEQFELPALLTWEEHPSMIVSAEGAGREQAVAVLQTLALRTLTAMPPGKIRFTVFDPVGLGENFGSLMHLGDFDDRLIASRIWTEEQHIQEQLVRLTTHMETVLQKYLRNEFATIHEYNQHAGEVAEPFQLLVIANFPHGFTEPTARRLLSILSSGPRCGVHTLMSLDRGARLPNNFRREELLEEATELEWIGAERPNAFRWNYSPVSRLPLTVDLPPALDRYNGVVRWAGKESKEAIRVEVPFHRVAPASDAIWQESCAEEFVVPVGRAGATRTQPIRLGKGTSQHVLICGKTGSGKSTLLHALITNAALRLSPDELEFYLIDFKKGVEFKCYATSGLPHARVIAVESEREFGLSVLGRLDEELGRRGELFRKAGVQSLGEFRRACPEQKMPRTLLVVDEFQELFVEDDKLAQDASLLLDRLVRQGRAFGMHVILGSQTLSGSYSLPRSTMGQMAVRIALQCSESDAHVILNDERNPAARYLNRPGEAIYNDQNGLLVGNQPFQVVWLSEEERLRYLRLASSHVDPRAEPLPPIVFEGNLPADPQKNRRLTDSLHKLPTRDEPQRAWLGDAVAIKDPTHALFARHAGSNLLVVGVQEDSAVGTLSSAVLSLAASSVESTGSSAHSAVGDGSSANSAAGDGDSVTSAGGVGTRIVILDGTRPESPESGVWHRVADAAPEVISCRGVREADEVLTQFHEEMKRREASDVDNAPPWYLVIHNGGRFRQLRKGDDDFGFSLDADKPLSPDKQLAELLKNGPAVGVHLLVWCDSYNNVTRMFDRNTMREFEMRVLFQVSAADSTNLIDTPAAAKLRVHRGLFYSDELGTAEKFRPYSPPTESWLATVSGALRSRKQHQP